MPNFQNIFLIIKCHLTQTTRDLRAAVPLSSVITVKKQVISPKTVPVVNKRNLSEEEVVGAVVPLQVGELSQKKINKRLRILGTTKINSQWKITQDGASLSLTMDLLSP